MSPERHIKISVGFAGGQVLAARVSTDSLNGFRTALGGADRWFDLAIEDGSVRIDLTQVAYVRVDSDEPRVGFGA